MGGESGILGRGGEVNKMWWKWAGMETQLETWVEGGETRHGGLLSHEMESPLVVGSVSRLREGRS